MKIIKRFDDKLNNALSGDRGSALIIVFLLLALLTVYVTSSLMSATSDAIASNNEVAQQRGFYTAYSKLEQMSRNFSALFLNASSPSYDSMCRVVIADPSLLSGFRIEKPDVTCPLGLPCAPSYSGKYTSGTDLYDLGWAGTNPRPFCFVDVCNPNAAPLCNFPVRPPTTIQIEKGDYLGLRGFARRYRMVSSVVSVNRGGDDVQLRRDFDNILLPIFQFGIFTENDFELYTPPNWAFGGWVHTNGDFYVTGQPTGNNISFARYTIDGSGNLVKTGAQITVGKHLVMSYEKTGGYTPGQMTVYRDATNSDVITAGSAIGGAKIDNCNRVDIGSFDAAPASSCGTFTGTSSGTIKLGVKKLHLPIQNLIGANPIELIKRGLPSDYQPSVVSPLISARYYYKPSIRVTLTDYQNQLPRTVLSGDLPSAGTGAFGGVQLDGPDPWLGQNVGAGPGLSTTTDASSNANWHYQADGEGNSWPIPRGYQPKIMDATNGRPTGARINGYRIHGWIKVELVKADGRTFDITQEILNLGVTVPYRADTSLAFYYPRATADFPPFGSLPAAGPYPDENSVLHLQRFAVPYTTAVVGALAAPPNLATGPDLNPVIDVVDGGVTFDYYASMALRAYNNSSIGMYGIEDNIDTRTPKSTYPDYTTPTVSPSAAGTTPFAEPQTDSGGYYTDAVRYPLPVASLLSMQIDFTGAATNARSGTSYLSENTNLPKSRASVTVTPTVDKTNAVKHPDGETTWFINGRRLVPFPINLYDSREGLPHQQNSGPVDKPIPGLESMTVTKLGVMNLVEIDMGNLGRMLRGEFNALFAAMGTTPYRTATGGPLTSAAMRDNIDVAQDNGWLVYVSDRRGDEPVLTANPNIKPGSGAASPTAGTPSAIGNGEYNRENVVWNPGGNTSTGTSDSVPVKTGGQSGCTAALVSDDRDEGKSPQDSNNDCFIETETGSGQYSESSLYVAMFTGSQINPTASFSNFTSSGVPRVGNMIAMTQVGTNLKQSWSVKPPVRYQGSSSNLRVEMFRRAVRLVNAANLFPTGTAANPFCTTPLGVTITTENPVYVFGNYNAPAGAGIDNGDAYPGLSVTPSGTEPTSPARYNGQDFAACGSNCHVPAAIIADAVTFLSGACVGTSNTNWSAAAGYAGWLDARSFVMPYQALGYRPARNTVYRFAMVSGYTPSWYPTFWGNPNAHQGPTGQASSGALNNFPRFLEDWGQNNSSVQSATYAGSMIRIYKSRQANGVFKRKGTSSTAPADTDYVYRPPTRDWIFDLDFNNPCALPPGSPFLQLIDFKGFQQSVLQQ